MSAQSHDLKAPRPNSHGVLLFWGTVARRSFDRNIHSIGGQYLRNY